MLAGYEISADPELRDKEIRCSPAGFLALASQLDDRDYEFLLDQTLPDDHIHMSEYLFDELKKHLNDIMSLTLD